MILRIKLTRKHLDSLYLKYNRRDFVHPDPLEFLYRYENARDREIAGLIASSLAYGNVKQILKSVSKVLDKTGSPYDFLMNSDRNGISAAFSGFKHRFTAGKDLSDMLLSAKFAIGKYGSLEKCFMSGMRKSDTDIIPALRSFVRNLSSEFNRGENFLLPSPDRGSACKRLNLYLRWMVREDDVDPGGWKHIPESKLLIPLDVHMWNICREAGFTVRKQANLKSVLEITAKFAEINPGDPVKYDFTLSRFGIRDELEYADIYSFSEK
ncbi:MAG: TIGR02757 family protein [Victivallales bacterium]